MRTDKITLYIKGHGQYQVAAASLDELIETHLPASVDQLRREISEREGRPEHDFADLQTVTECLMILGELSGLATN
jgi:hypothetical protein